MKIIAILIILIGIYIIYLRNKAIKWDLKVENSWSQISIQIKAKINIIPNLLEVANKYADYEKDLISNITLERQKIINSESENESIQGNMALDDNIHRLFALAENYPDLKANETYIKLQNEIVQCEKKIAVNRQFYNDTVMLYNRFVLVFPHNIILKPFGFKEKGFLELDVNEQAIK